MAEIDHTIGGSETEKLLADRKTQTCNPRFAFAVIMCTLGSAFSFGFSLVVVNPPETVVREWVNTTHYDKWPGDFLTAEQLSLRWSLVVAIWAVGGVLGAPAAGPMANRLGRRGTLLLSNYVHVFAALLMVGSRFVHSLEMLIIGRFLTGLHCALLYTTHYLGRTKGRMRLSSDLDYVMGVAVGIAPIYLIEISSTRLRNHIGAIHGIIVASAILLGEILGLERVLGRPNTWNYLFGIGGMVSLPVVLALPFCPESPRYLFHKRSNKEKARQALFWLHGPEMARKEMKAMEYSKAVSSSEDDFKIKELVGNPHLSLALIVAISLHLSQVLSGVNVAKWYSTEIFLSMGFPLGWAQYITLGNGAVELLITLTLPFLLLKFMLRPLFFIGLASMGISAIGIPIAFIANVPILGVICSFTYIIGFSIGPGPVPWLMTPQLFNERNRGVATSLAVFTNWLANFIVGITFPAMQLYLDQYSFFVFAGLIVVFWIFLYARLPETRNRSFEEIQADFQPKLKNKGEVK